MMRLLMCAVLLALIGCAQPAATTSPEKGSAVMAFTVSSQAFGEGGPIPSAYTCDGADQPLPIAWANAPEGTAELALVMDDPDARGFVHWVVVGIPPDATALGRDLPPGAVAGRNDFGRSGYGGPCPPSGTHHYRVTLYALDTPLGLDSSATAAQVRSSAAGSTLASATLTGSYTRG